MADAFDEGWAILELMGHRRLAGYVSEVELAGASFLRLDVPAEAGEQEATQFYSPASVYCLTPCVEQLARDVAASTRPRPVNEWDIRRPALAAATIEDAELDDGDGDDDLDPGYDLEADDGVPF